MSWRRAGRNRWGNSAVGCASRDENAARPEHRGKTGRHVDDRGRCAAPALRAIARELPSLPAVLVLGRPCTWIPRRHVPPRSHPHAHLSVLDPSARIAWSIGRNRNRRPRHAHAPTFKVKAMHGPLFARVRMDGRTRRERALFTLAQYPVAFVRGGRKNRPSGNDRAPERHDEQLFGARCRGVEGEKGAEEPANRNAPVGVHAFRPVTAWTRRIVGISSNCVRPWRLCGGSVYWLCAAASRRLFTGRASPSTARILSPAPGNASVGVTAISMLHRWGPLQPDRAPLPGAAPRWSRHLEANPHPTPHSTGGLGCARA
jgi:hypothetical protein